MSTPIKYALDLTGKLPANKVTGEVHDLSSLPHKAFVLNYGDFYTDSLSLINVTTGLPLAKTQYVGTELNVDMTERTGLSVCSVIVVTDTTLPNDLQVAVTAQMVGGDSSASINAIQQLIDALNLDNRPVEWNGLIGKPPLFPPSPHLHDLGDVYGFEYIVAALERITQAIYVGDNAQLDAIYQYIDHQVTGIRTDVAALQANLTAHLADTTNPHQTTKAQVGLSLVNNYGWSSVAEAQAGASTTGYMNPALTASAIAAQVGNAFNAHIANTSNPHQVTKAQVQLGNVPNVGYASSAEATAGTGVNLMTPALTALAVNAQAVVPLNAHLNDTNNPHHTTAAQVGLGSVSNFPTATNQDGITGTSAALFMTPASTTAAITSQVGNTLTAHINNRANPHGVTAAQVGAYTTAQADATTNNLQTQLNNLNAAKQNNLGFTPVRQGGGSQQTSNVIYIGHSGAGPRLQVDSTDFGPFSFSGHHHAISDVDGLQAWLNDRPTTATVQAMINNSVSGSFSAQGAWESGWGQAGRMVFQWGTVNAGGNDSTRAVGFPIAFPNTCVGFYTNPIIGIEKRSTDNVVIRTMGDRRTYVTANNSSLEAYYSWLAVGW